MKNVLILVLIFGLFACKKTSSYQNVSKSEQFSLQEADFAYLKSSSKVFFKDSKQEVKASVNIRLKKDSIIWLSMRQAGIEGVRILVSNDSVWIIDRLQNVFYAYDFAEISEKLKFKVDFKMLQSLIVGNLPVELDKNFVAKKQDDLFVGTQNVQNLQTEISVSRWNNKLTKLFLSETNGKILLEYSEFEKNTEQIFPKKIQLLVNDSQKNNEIEAIIEHSKIELTDQELGFPFNIPKDFKQIK